MIDQISEIASNLFASKGYHSTRMEDIADALNRRKGSLYHYFSSKEALLGHLVERQLETALATLNKINEDPVTPPTVKFTNAISAHLNLFHQYSDLYSIFQFERLASFGNELANTTQKMAKRYWFAWHRLLENGIARGDFRPDLNIPLTIMAFEGIHSYIEKWFGSDAREIRQQAIDHFVGLILEGIKYKAR
jgi:AcrR family transcriptional regulator